MAVKRTRNQLKGESLKIILKERTISFIVDNTPILLKDRIAAGSCNEILINAIAKALLLYCGVQIIEEGVLIDGCAQYDENTKRVIAEEKISTSSKVRMNLCVFSKISGTPTMAILDRNEGKLKKVEQINNLRDSSILFLALIPTLINEGNAEIYYENIKNLIDSKCTDANDYAQELARFSNFIFSNITNEKIPLKTHFGNTFSVSAITDSHIDEKIYSYLPDVPIHGSKDFEVFQPQYSIQKNVVGYKEALLENVLDKTRQFTPYEQSLIPEIPDYYIVPREIAVAAKKIKLSSTSKRAKRNVLLKGPAGTGKTQMAKALATGLGLPYTHITCDAGMELFNLIGTILPATDGVPTMSSQELSAKLDLPSVEEIFLSPNTAYQQLTGKNIKDITAIEVVEMAFEKQMELLKKMTSTSEKDFVYVPSELIKAVKHGWLCEVQEPTVILQPGVLPGLNSLLEGGSITLPTGEIIERHPDSVIVFTMNTDYEGCRPLNESVLDRFPLKYQIELPDTDTMIARCSAITGFQDIGIMRQCWDVICEIRDYLSSIGYSTGTIGPRIFYDWVEDIALIPTIPPLLHAEDSLIPACCDDIESQEFIRDNIIAPRF